jgi:hypothetical protein
LEALVIRHCIAASLLAIAATTPPTLADAADPMYLAIAVAAMGDLRAEAPYTLFVQGAEAIARAKVLGCDTEPECELIDAVAQFYHRPDERSHDERLVHFERALSRSRRACPDDAAIARWHERASKAALTRAQERAEAAYYRRARP